MNDKEYFRLRKKLHDDFKRKIEALDVVWQMSNDCLPPKPQKAPQTPPKEGVGIEGNGDGKGKAAPVVEEAVNAAGERFSTKEIASWIGATHGAGVIDRSTISHSLKRMKSIELVEKGQGKRPSVWRKLTQPPAASTPEQAVEIRELIKTKAINAAEFKQNFLVGRYGVERLAELTAEQATTILAELNS